MKKEEKFGALVLVICFISFIVMVGGAFIRRGNIILEQEQKIQELNREIGEYQAMDSFWEEYMDLLDEIYRGKINEAVLEERVYWLQYTNIYDEDYVQQMYDDFEELVDIVIEYYETTSQEVSLDTYVAQKYPALYDRIIGY